MRNMGSHFNRSLLKAQANSSSRRDLRQLSQKFAPEVRNVVPAQSKTTGSIEVRMRTCELRADKLRATQCLPSIGFDKQAGVRGEIPHFSRGSGPMRSGAVSGRLTDIAAAGCAIPSLVEFVGRLAPQAFTRTIWQPAISACFWALLGTGLLGDFETRTQAGADRIAAWRRSGRSRCSTAFAASP